MKSIYDITIDDLGEFLSEWGEKAYRAGQVFDWLYKKRIENPVEMSNLPKDLRDILAESYIQNPLKLVELKSSDDGSRKALFECVDGVMIESVALTSQDDERITFCLSTQAGCRLACVFCATGKMGFRRDLSAGEIVAQVIQLERQTARPSNIVLMGMGESLLNFDEVEKFVKIISEPKGYALSERRITLSTAGLMKELIEFHRIHPKVEVAISLNASDDETRERLMPYKKLSSFREIIRSIGLFDGDLTFEYVLLSKVNDSRKDAERLAQALRGFNLVKVNLIRYNNTRTGFKKPPEERVLEFQKILNQAGIMCFIRRSLGSDISGACGQLATGRIKSEKQKK